jgi:hypothetical protein
LVLALCGCATHRCRTQEQSATIGSEILMLENDVRLLETAEANGDRAEAIQILGRIEQMADSLARLYEGKD